MEPLRKQRRITRACDFCHRRGLKCKAQSFASPPTASCLTCIEHSQECTRLRVPQKRGTKPRGGAASIVSRQSRTPPPQASNRNGVTDSKPCLPNVTTTRCNECNCMPIPKTQAARNFSGSGDFGDTTILTSRFNNGDGSLFKSRDSIKSLIDIYLDSIHPIFPLFCEKELWIGWREDSFPYSESSYLSLIAMCALSAQHAKKGALFDNESPQLHDAFYAEEYLAEALQLVPTDLAQCGDDLNILRSYALLSLIGTQLGDANLSHRFMGLYHGIGARDAFHDESRWPSVLDVCSKEVRRRIFWCMYRLEIHTACIMGHLIRTPESQTFVGYPVGIHHPAFVSGRDGDFEEWFVGWNFTTDLYRILEHAILELRRKRNAQMAMHWLDAPSKVASILKQLSTMETNLLPQFHRAHLKSSDSGRNRCGFQVANIYCTIHLVKMVAFTTEETTFADACQTAENLIASMQTIPLDYVRAFGKPLLQELSGVGHIMSSVTARPLSKSDHQRARRILLAMADFLESLKGIIDFAAEAGFRIRSHVTRMHEPEPEIEPELSTAVSVISGMPQQPNIGSHVTDATHNDTNTTSVESLDFLRDFHWPMTMDDTSWDAFTLPDINMSNLF